MKTVKGSSRFATSPVWQIRKDVRAQRKINSLRVYCGNRESGCTWEGDLSDHPAHARHCEFCLVKCPFEEHGCTAVITNKTCDAHMQEAAMAHALLMCNAVTALKGEVAQVPPFLCHPPPPPSHTPLAPVLLACLDCARCPAQAFWFKSLLSLFNGMWQ